MYASRPGLFIGIGGLTVPVTALAGLLAGTSGATSDHAPGSVAAALSWSGLAALAIALAGGGVLVIVQAATVSAVVEIDAGRRVTPWRAVGLTTGRWRSLLATFALLVVVVVALALTVVLSPLLLVLAVLAALWVPAAVVEELGPVASLRRSATLVRGRFVTVALLLGVANLLAASVGPLLGFVLILAGAVPVAVGNLAAGLGYAVLLPFVAITTTYISADGVVRHQRDEGAHGADVLPAEAQLS